MSITYYVSRIMYASRHSEASLSGVPAVIIGGKGKAYA